MQENRYSRQEILPEIGRAGQARLAASSVLCVGVGGLGGPALLYLAAAGVGRIGILDPDQVGVSNLHRQILYETADVGKPKADIALARLRALNPEIEIVAQPVALTADNAENFLRPYDLILDGTDTLEIKFLLNDAAAKFGKPLIFGAVQGFVGQAALFDAAHGPCYRCLFPEMPETPVQNCAEAGVLGPVAGSVAMLQATFALQYLAKTPEAAEAIGKIFCLDARTHETKSLRIEKNADCVCHPMRRAFINLQPIALSCERRSMADPPALPHEEIAPEELHALARPFHLIDVREVDEWDAGHLEGAIHWPLSRLRTGEFPSLTHNSSVIVYCASGRRSLEALRLIAPRVTANARSLRGGYKGVKR